MVEETDDISLAARIFLRRYKNKSCHQAVLRAIELESLGSEVSVFWWAVALELEKQSIRLPDREQE